MQRFVDAAWPILSTEDVSWIGFYLADAGAPENERLVLGPRRDRPACSPIGVHGVCGQAFVEGRSRLVEDVAALGEAYVACDPRDRSEIVIPLAGPDGVDAVLDLDSFSAGAFSTDDDQSLRAALAAAALPAFEGPPPRLTPA